MTEPNERTAVDVLLETEKQIKVLVAINQSLDLNIKVLSNKLNTTMERVDHILALIEDMPDEPGFTMVDDMNPHTLATAPPKRIQVQEEFAPPIPLTKETAPVGQRRTSRGEVLSPQPMKGQVQKPIKNVPTPSFPVPEMKTPISIAEPAPTSGKVPLSQRVVDRNSNSIFKADVEITNEGGSTVWKGQTGTTGKWTTALEPGRYHINIHKQTTQQKIQVGTELLVNDKTPRELPIMIVK